MRQQEIGPVAKHDAILAGFAWQPGLLHRPAKPPTTPFALWANWGSFINFRSMSPNIAIALRFISLCGGRWDFIFDLSSYETTTFHV